MTFCLLTTSHVKRFCFLFSVLSFFFPWLEFLLAFAAALSVFYLLQFLISVTKMLMLHPYYLATSRYLIWNISCDTRNWSRFHFVLKALIKGSCCFFKKNCYYVALLCYYVCLYVITWILFHFVFSRSFFYRFLGFSLLFLWLNSCILN